MKAELPADCDLLRAYCNAGDQAAFGALYDRYDQRCFLFIRRTLGSAHAGAAEDLHQETWIAVSVRGSTFDPDKASFCTWLFSIARNKVLDHFRKQKVAFIASSDPAVAQEVEDVATTAAGPQEEVASREMAHAIVTAVEALPFQQRETFMMFAEGEMRLDEIAAATRVGVETAKSRLRYARAALRTVLWHWGHTNE
ncbi:sigma-70 family RNA polymerase sigma factor [Ottowia sp.]|uniref:sigma-70 family RNA polymerase sigma factor n=1 Tax=Ottowia sp. TaxID=1898956 RepID=UPI0025CC8943|nr:sigma-70 family RNA polymerase sigma factor [Ottowia sp.]MBK6616577.1 sigma-70 family RNA polymerase sigma factor [Ottowia sp.]